MDFHLNDVQSALKDSAIEALREQCAPQRSLDMWARGVAIDEDLWTSIAALGWFGICVPESNGGLGLGVSELCLLAEQLGYVSAIGPIVTTLTAGAILGPVHGNPKIDQVLEALAQGHHRIAIGIDRRDPMPSSMRNSLPRAEWLTESPSISGTWPFMPWGESADTLLMQLTGPTGEEGVALVGSQAPGLSFVALGNIDLGTRWSHVCLAATPVHAGDWFRASGTRAANLQAVAIAAEILGACRRCLDLSVEYAGIRNQFGRAIGSFQAVRHLCADMYVGIENASSVTAYAAAAIDADISGSGSAASIAALTAHQVGTKVWTNALQVHGGVGFTWEHELHLCIKRILALQGVLGSPDHYSELLLGATL
jgi:alkylation response protein AidB-like acyl-CoA dehydrogenase